MENMEKRDQGADTKLTKNEESGESVAKEGHHPHYKNIVHLWEFLMELLSDDRCTSLISWSRKEHGEFKLKNQEEVARRWGKLKQRPGMNYDKLSRALRYYYSQGIIKKVPGQRLVYKFDKLPYEYKPRIVEIRLAKQKQKQEELQAAETRAMDLQTNSPQCSSPSLSSSPSPSSLSNSSPLPFQLASPPQAPLPFLPGNPYSCYCYQSPLIYNSSAPLQSWLEMAQTQALSDSCVSFPRSAPPYITTAKLSSFLPVEQCFSTGSRLTLMRCNSIPVSVITKNNQ